MIFGFIKSFLLSLFGLVIAAIGLPIAAIALPFRIEYPETKVPFTQYQGGSWTLVRLPSLALWWDNPADGALGDMRGWWDNYCKENYGKPCTAFYSMWQWLAIRNSANYWSRVIVGVDAARCTVERLAFGTYWQLLKATREDGKVFPLFEGEIPYKNGTHCFEWRIGWKVKFNEVISPDIPEAKRYWGIVFRVRPWVNV